MEIECGRHDSDYDPGRFSRPGGGADGAAGSGFIPENSSNVCMLPSGATKRTRIICSCELAASSRASLKSFEDHFQGPSIAPDRFRDGATQQGFQFRDAQDPFALPQVEF